MTAFASMAAPMYISAPTSQPAAMATSFPRGGFSGTPGSLRDMIIDSMFDQQTPTSFASFAPSSVKSDTADRLPSFEASFCQGYTCCGLQLDDLHHLLEHFEENHVTDLPVNSPRSPQAAIQDLKRRAKGIILQAQATPPAHVSALPTVSGPSSYSTSPAAQATPHPTPAIVATNLPAIDSSARPRSPALSSASSTCPSPSTPAGASIDMDDVSMDTDEASDGETSAFGAFSAAGGRARKSKSFASALGHLRGTLDTLNLAAANNAAARSSASASSSRSGSVCASPQMPHYDDVDSDGMDTDEASSSTSSLAAASGGGLPPSLFFTRRSTSPPDSVGTPASATSTGLPILNVPGLPENFVPPMPTLPSGRVWVPPANKPYKCPVPGCDKAYKQQNGLKYHRLHGHCNNRAGGATGKEAEGRETLEEKPYGCYVGAACGKRYKNMNGLRYHYMHSGEHGTIGLAMLTNSTHPPPLLPASRVAQQTAKAASRSASPASAKMPSLPLGIVST